MGCALPKYLTLGFSSYRLTLFMSATESSTPIVVEPISRVGGKIVLGVYCALLVLVLVRSLNLEAPGDFLCMAVFMVAILSPLPMLASMMAVHTALFSDRIEVTGLLGKTTTLMLKDCTAVRCSKGRAFSRSIVVQFGRRGKKVAMSNMRHGFWDVALALKGMQSEYDWKITYGLMDIFKHTFWLPEEDRGIKWV